MLFARNRKEIENIKQRAVGFLERELSLHINHKNNVICRAKDGLHFLGHVVTPSYIVVDKHTTKSVVLKLTLQNAASYKSLKLIKYAKETINRELAEILFAYYEDL